MATKTSTSPVTPFKSSPHFPSSSYSKKSPLAQQSAARSPGSAGSAGSYGCQREVFHPLSPRAEPSALLLYDSSEDDEDDEGDLVSPLSKTRRSNFNAKSSPLNPKNPRTPVGKRNGFSPQYTSPLSHMSINKAPSSQLEKTPSPTQVPLPDSDGESDFDLGSLPSSLISSSSNSPAQKTTQEDFPLASDYTSPKGKSFAAMHAQTLAERLRKLDLKAKEYSRVAIVSPEERKFTNKVLSIYTNANRFDPQEAAELEKRYQEKVHSVFERRLQEELRQAELARQEEERQRREKLEAARREAEERARQEQEELRRREQEALERKRKEEEAEQARLAKLKAEEDAAKRQAEERLKREKEAQEKAEKEKAAAEAQAQRDQQLRMKEQQQSEAAQVSAQAPQCYGRKSATSEAVAADRVLKNLKKLRHDMDENYSDFLKEKGLMQLPRAMNPKFGQLNSLPGATTQTREYFKGILAYAQSAGGPMVQANDFLLIPLEFDVPVPAGFIWTVNEIAKTLVRQARTECGVKLMTADPCGVVSVSTLATERFTINGRSFIDIFVARLLKRNPILRGELGPEITENDRRRLGWERLGDGTFEPVEAHASRLAGLSAVYAAIAGRDFRSSPMTSPYPIFNLWYTVANIINQPAHKITATHMYVMNAIMFVGAKKLVAVYGHQGKKLVDITVTAWAEHMAASGLVSANPLRVTGRKIKLEDWWRN